MESTCSENDTNINTTERIQEADNTEDNTNEILNEIQDNNCVIVPPDVSDSKENGPISEHNGFNETAHDGEDNDKQCNSNDTVDNVHVNEGGGIHSNNNEIISPSIIVHKDIAGTGNRDSLKSELSSPEYGEERLEETQSAIISESASRTKEITDTTDHSIPVLCDTVKTTTSQQEDSESRENEKTNTCTHDVQQQVKNQELKEFYKQDNAQGLLDVTENRTLERKDSSDDSDQLLSELDAVLSFKGSKKPHDLIKGSCDNPNGVTSSKKTISWFEYQKIYFQLNKKSQEIERLLGENEQLTSDLFKVSKERDGFSREVRSIKARNVEEIYLTQIKEMENTIATQQNEIKSLKDKLVTHDATAKRAVAALQNELKLRVDQVTKMYEDCLKEKDSMVMKYAQSEQRSTDSHKVVDKLNIKLRESIKEREKIADNMKNMKVDRVKVQTAFETKVSECLALTRELEKQKDSITSCDVKVKWANNKLKTELDAHKETKTELQRVLAKLKQAREETEQIRMNCQEIVKTYQESEEIKSNSLDLELKKKLDELEQQKQEKSDTEEVYQVVKGELDSLKKQYHDAYEELKTMKDKVQCLEDERLQQEATLDKFRDIIQTQKMDNVRLKERLENMADLEETLERERENVETLKGRISELEECNQDLSTDAVDLKKREVELMTFTEKLSAKNAHLQSENITLNSKVTMVISDNDRMTDLVNELETQNKTLSEDLSQGRKRWHGEYEGLSEKLTQAKKEVDELTISLEDVRDEIKTLKKRHTANKKDLTRQLQQVKKRLEFYEEDKEKSEKASMGSRTSSNGSLEKTVEKHTAPPGAPMERSRSSSQEPPKPEDIPDYEIVEPDKSKIIEKILRLQKAHVRKNEKLEFMEGHVKELLEEVQKKARIIQSYILREESGTLAPEAMDINKAQLSKKGGIMSSIQSSHVNDSHMTIQLSLQINKKLQAVLEDTILKNITLKENIDTLGSEIARLSGENRNLQLKIQSSVK